MLLLVLSFHPCTFTTVHLSDNERNMPCTWDFKNSFIPNIKIQHGLYKTKRILLLNVLRRIFYPYCDVIIAMLRSLLGIYGLWAGRDLYRAIPTVTRAWGCRIGGLNGMLNNIFQSINQSFQFNPEHLSPSHFVNIIIHCIVIALLK